MVPRDPSTVLFANFTNPKLKPLAGKRLDEVARLRGTSPQDTVIDLIVEDNSRVGTIYFSMSEDNVRRQTALPWMTFGSDAAAAAAEGVYLTDNPHPRRYGNFARLLGKYVREEKTMPLEEAVRKLTTLPAAILSIEDRGALKPGAFADVVVFDPATIRDHSTFENPHQYSTGVAHVWVNGVQVVKDGAHTGAKPGHAVRGRAWTGRPGGGCRASSADWRWAP
jgi:N-acyl-D-amino-acid deacylase